MKRLPVTGADRHSDGAYYLYSVADVHGPIVEVGETITIFLVDEPEVEAEAVVEFFEGWGSGWFGRDTSEWRDLRK